MYALFFGIPLILLGLIAVSSIVQEKYPDTRQYYGKIAPYQGWLGVVFALLGVWGVISGFFNFSLLSFRPVVWITWIVVGLLEASLGFILGYNLIYRYFLSKNPDAAEKGRQVLTKLIPVKDALGISAIILGLWFVVAVFIF